MHQLNELEPLEVLAQRLRGARQPVLLVGRGVLWSRTFGWVRELAAAVPQLRVATTPGAKGCFPESHAQSVGVYGFGGTASATRTLVGADLVIVLGSRLLEQSSGDWSEALGREHVFRFDTHAQSLVGAWTAQAAVEGDLRTTLPKLCGLVSGQTHCTQSTNPPLLSTVDATTIDGPEETPLKPRAVMEELRRLTDIAVCADAGNAMCWALEYLTRERPETFYVSLDWGTMGCALPLAIGLALAKRQHAIALTGDGSLAMSGGELHTAVELELPVIVVALNDSGAGMVRAGTAQWFPNERELPGLSYRTPIDLAAFAKSLGARGLRARTASELRSAIEQATSRRGPTLIDVVICRDDVPSAISNRVGGLARPGMPANGGGIC